MRCILAILLVLATQAQALDVCPAYLPLHEKDIVPRIRSGIPFKLLSLAADQRASHRRIVRVEFDLWDEKVRIETLGRGTTTSTLKEAAKEICRALSFPEANAASKYQYRLMLNPLLGEGLDKLKGAGDEKSGLLEINWERLAKDLESEKTLVESELRG